MSGCQILTVWLAFVVGVQRRGKIKSAKRDLSLSLHTSSRSSPTDRSFFFRSPGFSAMKRLGVILLHPGRDDSPSQGYPQHYIRQYPFLHFGEERHCESEGSCSRTCTRQCPGHGSNPGYRVPPKLKIIRTTI